MDLTTSWYSTIVPAVLPLLWSVCTLQICILCALTKRWTLVMSGRLTNMSENLDRSMRLTEDMRLEQMDLTTSRYNTSLYTLHISAYYYISAYKHTYDFTQYNALYIRQLICIAVKTFDQCLQIIVYCPRTRQDCHLLLPSTDTPQDMLRKLPKRIINWKPTLSCN